MTKRRPLLCRPCVSGFLPGIVIGAFTSALIISVWRFPLAEDSVSLAAVEQRDRNSGGKEAVYYNQFKPPPRASRTSVLSIPIKTPPRKLYQKPLTEPPGGSYDLLILIHSTVGAVAQRDAVRETWLSEPPRGGRRILARFVVGAKGLSGRALRQLGRENQENGDVLLLYGEEEEAGVRWAGSSKLLQAFSWAVENVNFSYVFKCNDATYAILDELMQSLNESTTHGYLRAYFTGSLPANRTTGTRVGRGGGGGGSPGVRVEEEWVLCSHYLPFPEGGGYIISQDLVQRVVEMGPELQHYHHDDIALGVWLSPFNDVNREHDVRFNTGPYSRGCNNQYLVIHRETGDSMRVRHHRLLNKALLCVKETQTRLSYRYNWSAPADRCCVREIGLP